VRKDSLFYQQSINVLKKSPLFQGIDSQRMEEILSHFTPVTLLKKNIINSWQTKDYFFLIIKGRVKVSQVNLESGREYLLYILKEGDVFDIISLFEKKENEVIIEAIDELLLLKTSTDIARDWLDFHPEFNKNFLPYLGTKMRLIENSAIDLTLYDTMTRLSRLILRYVDEKSCKQKQEYEVTLINDLSHESLAQMIGSVRKVVNLHIQELKKEGIINSKRGKLSVINLQKLTEKAKLGNI
jgi:CRP-like cAMP-binding protein